MTLHSKQRGAERPWSEPEISWDHIPRIEPGEYHAFCRSAKVYYDGHFKRWVCAVQFDVLSNDLTEVLARLTWFLNMGDRERPHAGRRGNYWQAWVRANGGPPKRKDRLSPRVFQGRYARVVVADTTKDFKQARVTEDGAYSVIREVVLWQSGRGETMRFPSTHSDQVINQPSHQGRLAESALHCRGYRHFLPKASALAGVEGSSPSQPNPKGRAFRSGAPVKGQAVYESTIGAH